MAEPTLQQHFYPVHSGPFTAEDRAKMPPLLVVEVISPSSRLVDPMVKRVKYQGAGVPSYWIADPVAGRLTVLELVDGSYVERAVVDGDDEVALTAPFPVTVHLRLRR
jgi:Uma2 family endonuclease